MFLVTKSRSTRAWPVVVGHNSLEFRCTNILPPINLIPEIYANAICLIAI